MRSKKADATDMSGQTVQHSKCDRHAVIGRRASSELIKNDKRATGCLYEPTKM